MAVPSRNHHLGSPSFYGIMDYLTDYSAPHFFFKPQNQDHTAVCPFQNQIFQTAYHSKGRLNRKPPS